jgi:hypothetical protein
MKLWNRTFRFGALKKKADDNDKIRAEALPEDSTKSSSFDAIEGRETQQESVREISSSDERRDARPVKITCGKTESRGKTNRSSSQSRQEIRRRKDKADDSVMSKNTVGSKSKRSSCQRGKSLSRAEKRRSPPTSEEKTKSKTRSKSLGHRKRRAGSPIESEELKSACSPFDVCELSRLMEADDGSSLIDEGMYAASKDEPLVSDESELYHEESSHLQRQRQRYVERSDTLDTAGTDERPELDGCVAKYDNLFNACFEMGNAQSHVDKQYTFGGMKELTGAFEKNSGYPNMRCGALDLVDDSSIEPAGTESLLDLLRRQTVTRRKSSRRRDHERRRLTRSELEEKQFSWEEFFSAF